MTADDDTRELLRLYPAPREARPLEGAYLSLDLRRRVAPGRLLAYANYIASVDGRISLRDPATGEYAVPRAIANRRDWRLFQELAAQADVLVTSGRYFRQLAAGRAQDLLPIGPEPAYDDLRDWRSRRGLSPQPGVVVLSHRLDLPPSALARFGDRRVTILTGETADSARVRALEAIGVAVVRVPGRRHVDGAGVRRTLTERGYRTAYVIAGPGVLRTLLAADGLDELFLTTRHVLLGGESYHTLLEGELPRPPGLRLLHQYLDPDGIHGQTFSHYAVMAGESA